MKFTDRQSPDSNWKLCPIFFRITVLSSRSTTPSFGNTPQELNLLLESSSASPIPSSPKPFNIGRISSASATTRSTTTALSFPTITASAITPSRRLLRITSLRRGLPLPHRRPVPPSRPSPLRRRRPRLRRLPRRNWRKAAIWKR